MAGDPPSDTRTRNSHGRAVILVGICALVFAIVPLAGISVASFLAQRGSDSTWSRWSNVGETFGAINSVLSGLALAALIVTFWVQYQELREQRAELAMQHQSLKDAQTELYRSAEANLRKLHLELIKMSIDDPDLAGVWPNTTPEISYRQQRQHLYANLIYQHVLLSLRISDYPIDQVHNSLRNLFSSQVMRDYWKTASTYRAALVPGSREYQFAALADEICREYERVLVSNNSIPGQRRRLQVPDRQWRLLNLRSPSRTRSARFTVTRYPALPQPESPDQSRRFAHSRPDRHLRATGDPTPRSHLSPPPQSARRTTQRYRGMYMHPGCPAHGVSTPVSARSSTRFPRRTHVMRATHPGNRACYASSSHGAIPHQAIQYWLNVSYGFDARPDRPHRERSGKIDL